MRLGTSSPLSHSSPEEWVSNQLALGCTTVVFPLSCDDPMEKILAYKEQAEKSGITIAEVGIWKNAQSLDPEEKKKNLEYCIKQLQLADLLGARCAVNVAGALGPVWEGGYKENLTKEAWKSTVEMVRTIIDSAEVKNTYFTLEPMPWMYPMSPKEYLQLLEDVDRDRFAVHMDIINMVSSAERYFHPEEFVDECFELLGKYIRSCHIKDIHRIPKYTVQLEECAPGEGEFPLRYYAEKIHALDPEMPVILEHLHSDEEYIHYMNYLKEELYGLYKII